MKSFLTHLELLYPTAKFFDKSQIKKAYNSFLKEQMKLLYHQSGRPRKSEEGMVEKLVNCRFHKWHYKVVKTNMKPNFDGLVKIRFERRVDHIHSKFLKNT